MRELDDISNITVTPETLCAAQQRISLGGEMYTAIRDFLDVYYAYKDEADLDFGPQRNGVKDKAARVRRKFKALEKASEAWANGNSVVG